MAEDQSAHEAYLEGRLIGLNELILILKDTMESGGDTSGVVKSIVDHISNEMAAILEEMKEAHGETHPTIRAAESKVASVNKAAARAEPDEALRMQVANADALLKNLMALQKQGENKA